MHIIPIVAAGIALQYKRIIVSAISDYWHENCILVGEVGWYDNI
jgi:hypothetical protein